MISFGLKAALWRLPRKIFVAIGDYCWRREFKAAEVYMEKRGLWKKN